MASMGKGGERLSFLYAQRERGNKVLEFPSGRGRERGRGPIDRGGRKIRGGVDHNPLSHQPRVRRHRSWPRTTATRPKTAMPECQRPSPG
jgi:hypothetical protein